MNVKDLILTKNDVLYAPVTEAGRNGCVIVHQDSKGGHTLTLGAGNSGFCDVGLTPGAKTHLYYIVTESGADWTSTKITSDVVINPPSTVTNLKCKLADVSNAKFTFSAPQGMIGSDVVKADSYYLLISTSPIPADNTALGIRQPIEPKAFGNPEEIVISGLEPITRYYAVLYSEKSSYGALKRSAASNQVTFTTEAVNGNPAKPKRIPLDKFNILEALLHISFEEGERFTNYPSFTRLADQDYLVDNNGTPEGMPANTPVARYQSYGTIQPSAYNVGAYKVIFILDGTYDLDYIYLLNSNNNRFGLHTSTDGVNWTKGFDKQDTPVDMNGWTRISLIDDAKKNINFIGLWMYDGVLAVNGFCPYGTRHEPYELKGRKYKQNVAVTPLKDQIGTNAFIVEENYNYMSELSSLTRLYNEWDWIMHGMFREQGAAQQLTKPNDIQMNADSHMGNYDVKLKQLNDGGQKILWDFVACPVYLRPTTYVGNPRVTKPVDPGKNPRDLKDTTNPLSYTHMARIAASMAYRFGSNKNAPEECNQFVDNKRGLGLIEYFEMGNETDRYWDGADAFTNAAEMYAFLTAVYDGDQGRLGAGFGLKAADPNAKLAINGLVSPNTSYVREMMIISDYYRGKGNYPWDLINWHHYNAYTALPDTPVWSNVPAYGMYPEIGDQIESSEAMNEVRSLLNQNAITLVSEGGYDEQYGGMHSPPDRQAIIRGRNKGIWLLRSALIYAAYGVDLFCQYWYAGDTVNVKDLDPNNIQRELFMTSGYMDGKTWAADRNRVPLQAYWFMATFRKNIEGLIFSHMVVQDGVFNIKMPNAYLTTAPNLWVAAYRNALGDEHYLISWLGIGSFASVEIDFRASSILQSTTRIGFENQDVKATLDAQIDPIALPLVDGQKWGKLTVTETPCIVRTKWPTRVIPKELKNFRAVGTSPTSIKATWTDRNVSADAMVRIYVSEKPDEDFTLAFAGVSSEAEITLTGLKSNTTYWIKGVADLYGSLSEETEPKPANTLYTINAPTGLKKISATSSTITIGWDYVQTPGITIDGFVIYRAPNGSDAAVEVGRVLAGLRTFRDAGLVANSNYLYLVRAFKDGVLSPFSASFIASSELPSNDSPIPQEANTTAVGSMIEIAFNEDLKDEQTAVNAFTILERYSSGETYAHPATSILIGSDKTKVRVFIARQLFRDSVVTIGYNGNIGGLKSVGGVPVQTFSGFRVNNNVLMPVIPMTSWTNVQGFTVERNSLIGNNDSRASISYKLSKGATGFLRFNLSGTRSVSMSLDKVVAWDKPSEIYVSKTGGVLDWKVGERYGVTSRESNECIFQFRGDGITLYLEVSYNGAETFEVVTTTLMPAYDLLIKADTTTTGAAVFNVVSVGLTSTDTTIVPPPPTNMTIDDQLRLIGFDPSTGYPLDQHEYTASNLATSPTWITVTTNPIMIGEGAIPRNGFAIRVKEATGRRASARLTNQVPISGSQIGSSKLTVLTANGAQVVFSSDSFELTMAYIKDMTFDQDMICQFNTSDVYYLEETFAPLYNNGRFWLTFQGAPGVRPILDVKRKHSSVMRIERNNTALNNMELRNADIEDFGGCIIRADETTNTRYTNLILDYGYCGMRATTACHNIEIDNVIVRNTKEGSFRLGNGVIQDMTNISIRNVKLDDVTNGGLIEGSQYPFYGGFALKVTDGIYIENVGDLRGDRLYNLGLMETSTNVTIKNIRGIKFQMFAVNEFKLINAYLRDSTYLAGCRDMSFIHSQLDLNMAECGKIDTVRGCVFVHSFGGQLTIPTDVPRVESDNVFVANISGEYINYSFKNSPDKLIITDVNLAQYKLSQGLNSKFVTYQNRATVNLNPFGGLRTGSVGKKMITSVIDGVTVDTMNVARFYPTDAGAFSGVRADENDKPVPPTVTGNNLARTLIATHPLGTSQIEYSKNGAVWTQYTDPINVGDFAIPAGEYRFRTKAAVYRDPSDPAISPAFTDKPDLGDYKVLRSGSISFNGIFCQNSDARFTQMNPNSEEAMQPGADALNVPLVGLSGASLTIGDRGFDAPACAAVGESDSIYPNPEMSTAWRLNSTEGAQLKFTGLIPANRYQFYFACAINEEAGAVKLTIGDKSQTVQTFNNLPLKTAGDIYSNPAITRFQNVKAAADGTILIDFAKAGSGYTQLMVNVMTIEESNIDKPA